MKGVCVFLFLLLFLHHLSCLMFGMRVFRIAFTACKIHMADRSSWQEDEPRRVFGLQRVSMVIWVLKLLLLPIDGCWYLVSDLMYLCRCHLRHFLLISPWTYKTAEHQHQKPIIYHLSLFYCVLLCISYLGMDVLLKSLMLNQRVSTLTTCFIHITLNCYTAEISP